VALIRADGFPILARFVRKGGDSAEVWSQGFALIFFERVQLEPHRDQHRMNAAEKLGYRPRRPSAAEAGTENRAFIAAVNRCATQKQGAKAVNRCATQKQEQKR
jgi:hypothetical protein